MRIVRAGSPSLPLLDPLKYPSEYSWADQVEQEEAADLLSKHDTMHRYNKTTRSDSENERSRQSSEWADRMSRGDSHQRTKEGKAKANLKVSRSSDRVSCRPLDTRSIHGCDHLRREARSGRQKTWRQTCAFERKNSGAIGDGTSLDILEAKMESERRSSFPQPRSHPSQRRENRDGTLMQVDNMSEGVKQTHHLSSKASSDGTNYSQSHRARDGRTHASRYFLSAHTPKHRSVQDVQAFEIRDGAKPGHCRGAQDMKAEIPDNLRLERTPKPPELADNEKWGYPRWHNKGDGRRSGHVSVHRKPKGKEVDELGSAIKQGVDDLKLEIGSDMKNQLQKENWGCIHPRSCGDGGPEHYECTVALSDSKIHKCTGDGIGDPGIVARYGLFQESILHDEVGYLVDQQGLHEEYGEHSANVASQACKIVTKSYPEGVQKKVSSSMLDKSIKDDGEPRKDDSLNSKKQYQILADLLLDDPFDIGPEFDEMLVPEGPELQCCESIFGNDFHLPVSLDVEASARADIVVSAEKREAECASQPAHIQRSQLSAVLSTISSDGKSNNLQKRLVVEDLAGYQLVGMRKPSEESPVLKPSERVFVDVTNKFEILAAPVKRDVEENDIHRLSQRQRQVEYGKNTLGYERYSEMVPRYKRKPQDPHTPNPKQVCSKRSWDGQIRKWRRLLHAYDLPKEDGEENAEDFSSFKARHGHSADSTDKTTRCTEAIENIDRNGAEVMQDANLTIYDDWIVS